MSKMREANYYTYYYGKDQYRDSLRPSFWQNPVCWFLKHRLTNDLLMTANGRMYQICIRCSSQVNLKGNGWD